MSSSQEQPMHTNGVVSDYFAVETHLIGTRTADAYQAIDQSRNIPICLWIMKHPLALHSEAVKRFLARMQAIDAIQPPLVQMSAYGVDAEGTAFSLFPPLDGYSVVSGNIEVTEAERRFISCARAIEKLHSSGVVCGDLCGSSFWVDRLGDVSLIGLMGSFDSEAMATAMLPPPETIPFIAPEQRSGGGVEKATDVFALGVLAYYLLTRSYPFGQGAELMMANFDLGVVRDLTSFGIIPPIWAQTVIFGCLDPDLNRRFSSAGAILKAIADIRQRSFSQEQIPVLRGERSASLVAPPTQKAREAAVSDAMNYAPMAINRGVVKSEANAEQARSGRSSGPVRLLLLMICAAIALLLAIQVVLWFKQRNPVRPEPPPPADIDPASQGARLSEDDLNKQQFEAELSKLRDSDDPLSHHLLIKGMKEAKTEEARRAVENALLQRVRRMGAMRAVEQVRPWLRKMRPGSEGPEYEAILKTLDFTLPMEERASLLRQAYRFEPELVLRLAAALALDSGKMEEYQPILSQLLGDALEIENAGDYSGMALILAHYQLSTIFGDDIVQNRDKLSNKDIDWLLPILAKRGDINTRAVANLALQRDLLPPLRALFLKIVRDKADVPPEVVSALINAAGGALTVEDVGSLGRWYDVDGERILLAMLADGGKPEIMVEIFDVLAGKNPKIEPSASVIEWVRQRRWNDRGKYARLTGMVAYLDVVEPGQIEKTFADLDREPHSRDLVDILLDTDNAVVSKLILERYPQEITLGRKLAFLSHRDAGVRKAAVQSIQTNDAGALKIISDAYSRETVSEIKEIYKQKFEMIRERSW